MVQVKLWFLNMDHKQIQNFKMIQMVWCSQDPRNAPDHAHWQAEHLCPHQQLINNFGSIHVFKRKALKQFSHLDQPLQTLSSFLQSKRWNLASSVWLPSMTLFSSTTTSYPPPSTTPSSTASPPPPANPSSNASRSSWNRNPKTDWHLTSSTSSHTTFPRWLRHTATTPCSTRK